ncbi:MAG: A/G-specific adenine glycosylase [Patescibacteria group bacterium]
MTIKAFQKKIYDHYEAEKRPLPWRTTRDPYKILVSELMLQQTGSARVMPKYAEFLKKFPSVSLLAAASVKDVLSVWQGLGYNRRALNLHKAARIIVDHYKGKFPKERYELLRLPGLGPYTASALVAFAYNEPVSMIETNIRTVFIYFFFPGKKKVSDASLMPFIEKYNDHKNPREWYNALMDYGAMLKKTFPNPSRTSAHYAKQSAFEGSLRQVRGAIIKAYIQNNKITKRTLFSILPYTKDKIESQYNKLKAEGFFAS